MLGSMVMALYKIPVAVVVRKPEPHGDFPTDMLVMGILMPLVELFAFTQWDNYISEQAEEDSASVANSGSASQTTRGVVASQLPNAPQEGAVALPQTRHENQQQQTGQNENATVVGAQQQQVPFNKNMI